MLPSVTEYKNEQTAGSGAGHARSPSVEDPGARGDERARHQRPLEQISGDVLQVSDGSLYPALHKLEQSGWVTASWQTTENNRRAKFYALSRLGRRHLEKEAENWARLSAAINHIVSLNQV